MYFTNPRQHALNNPCFSTDGTIFELGRHMIIIHVLSKLHHDGIKNVTSRVLTMQTARPLVSIQVVRPSLFPITHSSETHPNLSIHPTIKPSYTNPRSPIHPF
ncbi:hypothetical protein DPMN_068010 [Dreissena polymorpha]|uniref:Uncharacterized protein n=1 Tax=Dreissena polymorpha TaxID=45954 RepID=A0A9D4BLT9_DREPO|nr:hypothetical protein DPMN_068010 [Dreissena polymorpha]